jgi:hypothetical protein
LGRSQAGGPVLPDPGLLLPELAVPAPALVVLAAAPVPALAVPAARCSDISGAGGSAMLVCVVCELTLAIKLQIRCVEY